jgi:hypothetical protein
VAGKPGAERFDVGHHPGDPIECLSCGERGRREPFAGVDVLHAQQIGTRVIRCVSARWPGQRIVRADLVALASQRRQQRGELAARSVLIYRGSEPLQRRGLGPVDSPS